MINLVNLTTHAVVVIGVGGDTITFQPSGKVARVAMEDNVVEQGVSTQYGWVAVNEPTYKEAVIPACEECCAPIGYIVSSMFADAFRQQNPYSDAVLYVPDSGPSAIRGDGQIKAVRRLIRK